MNITERTADARLLYTRKHLQRLGINLSNSSLLRLEATEKFPKRIRIGAHSVAWIAAEIHEHIVLLATERETSR
jgi:predicted DNA-binding transcriptional regulator AlpA